MADVKWIKIVTDVFDDEKILMIESLPECDSIIVIWFKLLCLAGKQNNCGVFQMGRMPYTDEMFATIFRRPLNTVRLALEAFERYGMIEIINDTVTIPNWGKHQSIDRIEARNEYMRGYMKEYRTKQKAITDGGKVNSKVNSKVNVNTIDKNRKEETRIEGEEDNNTPPEPSDTVSEEFEELWHKYPRKEGKKAALASYKRARKKGVEFNTVLDGILNYLSYIEVKKIEPQFIKQGSTWFNGEHWNDEYDYSISDVAPAQSNNVFLNMLKEEI